MHPLRMAFAYTRAAQRERLSVHLSAMRARYFNVRRLVRDRTAFFDNRAMKGNRSTRLRQGCARETCNCNTHHSNTKPINHDNSSPEVF